MIILKQMAKEFLGFIDDFEEALGSMVEHDPSSDCIDETSLIQDSCQGAPTCRIIED